MITKISKGKKEEELQEEIIYRSVPTRAMVSTRGKVIKKEDIFLKGKAARNNKEKGVREDGEIRKNHEDGNDDEFMKITSEDRSNMKGLEFYIIEKGKVKSG